MNLCTAWHVNGGGWRDALEKAPQIAKISVVIVINVMKTLIA